MLAAKRLENSTNWVQAAPSIQMEVHTTVSTPRGRSPCDILLGFDPKLGSTPLPIQIPYFSNPAKRFYKASENITKAKIQERKPGHKNRRAYPSDPVGSQVMLSTKNLPARYNL